MFAVRGFQASSWISLDAACKQVHDDRRSSTLSDIKERKKLKIPLDGLADHGKYIEDEDFKTLKIKFRTISELISIESQGMMAEASSEVEEDDKKSGSWRSSAAMLRAARFYVSHAVKDIDGLEDEDGNIQISAETKEPLNEDELDVLDANGLIFHLFVICRAYNELTPREKKVFGVPQRLISVTSVARNVPSISESAEAV